MLDVPTLRRRARLATGASAIAGGGAAWLALGPLWAAPGMVVAGVLAVAGWALIMVHRPDAMTLLERGRPQDALTTVERLEPQHRLAARKWGGWWSGMLADALLEKSAVLHALNRDREALQAAAESVNLYRALASDQHAKYAGHLARALSVQAGRLAGTGELAGAIASAQTAVRLLRELARAEPGEHREALARVLTCLAGWLEDIDMDGDALAAAHEAAGLYWAVPDPAGLGVHAARAALREGRLLCREARYAEAAVPLARGWLVASRLDQQDELAAAVPALRAACRALAADLATVWRAETGSALPGWLAGEQAG